MIRKQNDIVGSLFQDIAHLIRQRIDNELQPFGLTRLKWLAIGLVQTTPGMTQSELAARLELKPAATGKLVDRLVSRELVERRADPGDRRVHRLFVTEKSDNLLIELEPVGTAIREDVLQDFGSKERKQLEDLLNRLKQRLV
ncbi:MarR family winged helix-turn-helix transcriptional regulator [Pseudaestuariivita atlantica]|uniref:HTH marR-type domain-containing protein n=1 Tax=Pseudaestuariivita atlantica TaxID=1317121 RepID=A0A0L1JSD0_9RHOB|nr:MarR family transcriptional regulator [Pseudaestuariivita atlantica]KNG94607.1 hypothetical protein ATO11_04170 [Pseudaestuariivita atlantica]